MITLNDKDVVGLVTIGFEIAETLLESLVREGVFDKSDIEYFCIDVGRAIRENVHSDLAQAALNKRIRKMQIQLNRQVDEDQAIDEA